jgi:hypothetical protein
MLSAGIVPAAQIEGILRAAERNLMSRNLSSAAAAKLIMGIAALPLAASAVLAQTTASPSVASKIESLAALKASVKAGAALNPNLLGSSNSDLVYTPVAPCRIVDTRNAIGAFTSPGYRSYDLDGVTAAGANYSAQGGLAGSCNIPYGVVSAAALNITVTAGVSGGYLTAWDLGTQPNASTINWIVGETLANTTIVPINPGGGADFKIYSSGGVHVIVDVVGYFAPPAATTLDCQIGATLQYNLSGGTGYVTDQTCPAGYTLSGGGAWGPNADGVTTQNLWVAGGPTSSTTWRQYFTNTGATARVVQAQINCCRIPGR